MPLGCMLKSYIWMKPWSLEEIWVASQNFATLGSILDSQQSWKSGQYQLARWSHEVAWFWGNHPPTQSQPIFFWQIQWLLGACFDVRCPPLLAPCLESMCGVRPLIGTLFRKYVRCPPLPVYTFSVRCPPPQFSSVPWTLWLEENWESGKFQQDEAKLNLYPRVWHS